MCGIFGAIGDLSRVDQSKIDHLLSHRGPDDKGVYQRDNVLFMHWRLAIQDLTDSGHQPMITDDDNLCLIFNGEIYNHWEIRKNFLPDYTFRSNSDTETLLYAYSKYGSEIFSQLNGIFALAFLDRKNKTLVLVRDHFGVKPLYYSAFGDIFLFASESKAIVETIKDHCTVNSTGINNYLQLLWSPGELTAFNEIKKLEPGHYLTISYDNITDIRLTKYYELPFGHVREIKDYKYWEEELEVKLLEALDRQLLSDVPIGFFLSGGLDSSLMVALYRKLYPKNRIKAYTISTGKAYQDEGFSDDLYYARKVAEKFDIDLTICDSNLNLSEEFERMVIALDEPQADLAPLHVENICRKAREQGYFVLISGAGGDDLFSGYRRHEMITHYKRLSFVPFGRHLLKIIRQFAKNADRRRIDKFLSLYHDKNLIYSLANSYLWLDPEKILTLFSSDFKKALQTLSPVDFLINSLSDIPNEMNELNQCLYWDMKFFLPDHNLNYTDKMSMTQAVEVRVPFLDKELVEFSAKLPIEYKMKGTTTKYILRKLAEKYLPYEVVYRSKTGFGGPLRSWIRNSLDPWVQSQLNEESVTKLNIFNYSELRKLVEENKTGKIDASYTILSIIAIQMYLRYYTIEKNKQFLP